MALERRVQRAPSPPAAHSHDRPTFEEQHVGFVRYRAEDGWIYVDGPSGKGGHGLTERGLDGVAYHVRNDVLELVEQKGISTARKVGMRDKPTAVTRNLVRNLDAMLEKMGSISDLPQAGRIGSLPQQTRDVVAGGGKVPSNVRIVVTSQRATGVTSGLSKYWRKRGVDLPVEFEGTGLKAPNRATSAGTPGLSQAGPTSPGAVGNVASTASEMSGTHAVPGGRGARASAAREITADAGKAATSELRALRLARGLKMGLELVGAIAAVSELIDFTTMSTGGLSGEGFMFTKQIGAARTLEARARDEVEAYPEFSRQLSQMQPTLFSVGGRGHGKQQLLEELSKLSDELGQFRTDLTARREQLAKTLESVRSRRKAAEQILGSPSASRAIAMATFGTAQLARIFAASQDLEQIEGAISGALGKLGELDSSVAPDLEFVKSWYQSLTST